MPDPEAKDNQIKSLQEEVARLQKELKFKVQGLENQFKDVDIKIKAKEELINNLQSSMKLKDDQIQTLKDSMKLKTEQITTLDNSIKFKDEKIGTLEKTLNLKEEEIKTLKANTVESSFVEEQNKQLKELENKFEVLKGELTKADEDLVTLEEENEKLRNQLAISETSKIIDWTDIEIPKSEILGKMRDILMNALHNVTIAVPSIKDLQDLYLYEVRSSVNMKISCSIDPVSAEDSELLEEFESLDNISIRMYDAEDRYVIDRDGEELLLGVVGRIDNNHLIIHTKDPKHIKFYRSTIMESWLRSRKIE